MKLLRIFGYIAIVLLMVALSGCKVDLAVENLNTPDKDKALATPNDVEGLAGGTFRDIYMSQTFITASGWATSTMADEFTSSWGNGAMRDLSSEPRSAWDNSPSYGNRGVNDNTWSWTYRSISAVNDVLSQIAGGMTFIDENGKDNTARGKAWCRFIQGIGYGLFGTFFDKAFIIDENTDLEQKVVLSEYKDVMIAAIGFLEECITICETNTFEVPAKWWRGNDYSQADLAKVAHSHIARFLAAVARTTSERDAVDWASVKSHAEKGLTEDWGIDCDGDTWWSHLHGLFSNPGWARADYKCIGPADTSGSYTAWLATPIADRNEFDIHTDDRRVTGVTPTDAGKYLGHQKPSGFRANRGTYHYSLYSWTKYADYYANGYVGWTHLMSVAEMNMLRAEAELRAGNGAAAAALINLTRVPNGELAPAVAGTIGSVSDARDPRGSLWAQMKYEKGIEIAQKNATVAWSDRRGWGTLVPGTVIHFPVPGSELELLLMDSYTFGGVGKIGGAPKVIGPFMDMPRL